MKAGVVVRTQYYRHPKILAVTVSQMSCRPSQRLPGPTSLSVTSSGQEWDARAAYIRSVSSFNSIKRFPASSKFSN